MAGYLLDCKFVWRRDIAIAKDRKPSEINARRWKWCSNTATNTATTTLTYTTTSTSTTPSVITQTNLVTSTQPATTTSTQPATCGADNIIGPTIGASTNYINDLQNGANTQIYSVTSAQDCCTLCIGRTDCVVAVWIAQNIGGGAPNAPFCRIYTGGSGSRSGTRRTFDIKPIQEPLYLINGQHGYWYDTSP